MEKDYAPLTLATVRALNDKLYEKRKVAALEIERMVREYNAASNTSQIKKLLKVLGQDFALSSNPHSRKGGLIGLAATAIALGKDTNNYISELTHPVLACFSDADSRVRYYACEALFNVVKVARGSTLPFFNDIFDGLSRLAADPDQNVKNGSELLDRLMKDIVTESASFDLVAFIPLLRERIYTKNPFAKQFVVSWITVLDSVPDINMVCFLPEILDGLFQILGDPNQEIKKMCEAALGEFLKSITSTPEKVNFPSMVNILIVHAQSNEDLIQFTAITWLKEFVRLSERSMLPYASGLLTAILPCLAYDDERRNLLFDDEIKKSIIETSKIVNNSLMKLITPEDDKDPEESIPQKSEKSSNQSHDSQILLALPPVVEVLSKHLLHNSTQTRLSVLRWIYHLHIQIPNKIFQHVDELFPVLMKTLSDPCDEVVLRDLEVLAEISSSPAGLKYTVSLPDNVKGAISSPPGNMNSYFLKFLLSLMNLFATDSQLLDDRGSFIIQQLCVLLSAEDIYRTFAEILLHEEDIKFASHMVQTLNIILLTSKELFELRNRLKDLKTENSCSLFVCLYRSWCFNPVATVSLCFLTQNYRHASQLLQKFGDLEVTVEFLTEIDKLVQLIESPIFTYLRLQLLDTENN